MSDGSVRAYDVFVSYNRKDGLDARWLVDQLIRAGYHTFFDRNEILPGRLWREQIEQVVGTVSTVIICIGKYGFGDTQRWEVRRAIETARASGERVVVIPVWVSGEQRGYDKLGELAAYTAVDLVGRRPDGIADLLAAIKGEGLRDLVRRREAELANRPPFRGLSAFREDDAPYFFGRETVSQDLAQAVSKHRFVSLVGASGSGKSSVVFAGLVPHLRRSEGGRIWTIATMRPGPDPLMALAQALTPVLAPELKPSDLIAEEQALRDRLMLASGAANPLPQLIKRYAEAQGPIEGVLLIVDQFEELFTLVRDERIVARFLEALEACVGNRDFPIHVLVTLREDHEPAAKAAPAVGRLLGAGKRIALGAMTELELRRAIEEPAAAAGLRFDEGLVDIILRDLEGQRGALPLLEFLLHQLWAERSLELGLMTRAAYTKVGGVRQAIARHADAVYGMLRPEDAALAQGLFQVLVHAGKDTQSDTRRPIELARLSERLRQLALQLTGPDARLLVTDGQKVEITHEALLRVWSRLSGWVDAARAKLQLRERLETQALLWEAETTTKPDAATSRLLAAGAAVDEAVQLVKTDAGLLEGTPIIARFVAASEQSVRLAADVAAQGRKATERLGRMFRMAALAAVLAVGVVGAVGAFYYRTLGTEADANRTIALEASNTIVNRVSRDLSETEGVPPAAISSVLSNAQRILEGFRTQLRGGDDPRQLKLVVIDLLTQSAATRLVEGNFANARQDLGSAETKYDEACGAAPADRRCALRRAEVMQVRATLALLTHPASAKDARTFAAAGLAALAQFLPAAADGGNSGPGNSVPSDETRVVMVTAAALRILDAQALLAELDAEAASQARPALAQDITKALDNLQQSIAGLTPQATSSGEPSAAQIALSALHRLRAALLITNRQAEEAAKAAGTAVKSAHDVRKTNPASLIARIAHAEALIVHGVAEASRAPAPQGAPQAAAAGLAPAPLPPSLLQGFKELHDYAIANPVNQLIRIRYMQLWRLTRRAFAEVRPDWQWQDIESSEVVEIRRSIVSFALSRLTPSGLVDETEAAYLRSEALESAQSLLWTYSRQKATDKTLALAEMLKLSILSGSIPANDETAFLNKLRTLFWIGLAHRDKRDSTNAVAQFITIDELLKPRMSGLNCNAKERTDTQKRYCFFSSYVATFLGSEETWKGTTEATIDADLDKARKIVEQLRNANTDNVEFKSALAVLLMTQGQRSEKRSDEPGALKLYQESAQLGSEGAVRRLRDYQQRNLGSRDVSAMAFNFEQRQRDTAPVLVEVVGTSRILRGSNSMFSVFLEPPQGNADPVARELQRLENYYGVTLDEVSITKLRNIVAGADQLARKAKRTYVSRDLRQALENLNDAEERDRPYGSTILDPALKEHDYAVLNAEFGRALEALDKARAEVVRQATSATSKPELEYEWGILGMKYLQLAEASRRRNSEDRSSGSTGKQIWSSVTDKAVQQSDETFGRAFSGDIGAPATRSAGVVDQKPFDRGVRLFKLAQRMVTALDEINKRGTYIYRDAQTFGERMNENMVFALERALALLFMSRKDVAGPTYQVDWYIINGELMRGNALRQQTTNRPRPQDVLKIAKQGADFRGEAMDAYEGALAHLASFARGPAADIEIKQYEVNALLGIAQTHTILAEHTAAVRVLEKATRIVDDLIEQDRGNFRSRLLKATVLEKLATSQINLARIKYSEARALYDAGGTSSSSRAAEERVRRVINDAIEQGRDLFGDSRDSYLRANFEYIASLRIDPDRCRNCQAEIRSNMRKVVSLIDVRTEADFRSSPIEKWRNARLEAKEFAEQMMQELRQSEARVSNVRLVLGDFGSSRPGNVGGSGSTGDEGKKTSKSTRVPVAPSVIAGVIKEPWDPQELVKSFREQLELLDGPQGQARVERAGITALAKYIAILSYDMVAEFAIRTASLGDHVTAFREASIIYKALAEELARLVDVNTPAAEQYAVTLSDLAFALTVVSAKEPARVREARQLSDQAVNIDKNLYLQEPNIRLNAAHVLLIDRQFGAARDEYLNSFNWGKKKKDDGDWNWRNQLLTDLALLRQVFAGNTEMVQEIDRISAEARARK